MGIYAIDYHGMVLASKCLEVKNAPAQGTPEWLDWRKTGITATEAATVMFPDKYNTPMKLYTEKVGITEHSQDDKDGFFEWGHVLEDDIVRKFKSVHPELADSVTTGRLYQRGWAKCSLDAQCVIDGEPVILECKSSQSASHWNPYPDRYFAQVQWQLFVTGYRKAKILVLICEGGYHYSEIDIVRSEDFISKMVEECSVFYRCVVNRTPPAVTLSGLEPDKQAVAALRGATLAEADAPTPDEVVTRDEISEYERLKKEAEDATARFEEFKNKMGYRMLNAKRALCEGKTFASWVERKGSVMIDSKKLQELYPEAFEACKKEGLPSRYLRYSVPKFSD